MAYLDDHPPRIRQFRPRRAALWPLIGVHTAESFPDETGPDTGAENVADFIRRRTNYGCYHKLSDSDSRIQLVEFEYATFHIGTHNLNDHSIGISAATQAAKWNSLDDDYADAMVRNMAKDAADAARYIKRETGKTVPARRVTLAQALNGWGGFLAHGDADPDRRTDPGRTFPWSTFLAYYAAEMRGAPTPPEEDDMADLSDASKAWLQDLLRSWKDDFARELLGTEVTGTGQAEGILGPKDSRGDTVASLLAYAAAGGIRSAETRKYLIGLGVGYRNDDAFPALDADSFKLQRDAAMYGELNWIKNQGYPPEKEAVELAKVRARYEAAE